MKKKIQVKLDASQLIKVCLDDAQQKNVEHQVSTVSQVCKKVMHEDVHLKSPDFQL